MTNRLRYVLFLWNRNLVGMVTGGFDSLMMVIDCVDKRSDRSTLECEEPYDMSAYVVKPPMDPDSNGWWHEFIEVVPFAQAINLTVSIEMHNWLLVQDPIQIVDQIRPLNRTRLMIKSWGSKVKESSGRSTTVPSSECFSKLNIFWLHCEFTWMVPDLYLKWGVKGGVHFGHRHFFGKVLQSSVES